MGSLKAILVNTLTFLQFVSAVYIPPRPQRSTRAAVLAPSDDPFYISPPGYESHQPGSILRTRSVDSIAFGGSQAVNVKTVFQLLFRSTDSLGNAATAVTTVIIPNNANMTRLLSYQTAEDSAWINCAPSYTLQLGSPANFGGGDTSSFELLLIIAALDEGWIVNVPDYEGFKAAYTSGLQAGRATLDSVRAALASGSLTGISPDAEYQMWGYSGGALASERAVELQLTYAPELNFIGAAIGSVTPSVISVLNTVNGGEDAGLIPAAILGLTNAFPELKTFVDEHLIPGTAAYFERPLNQCSNEDSMDFLNQNIFSYFDLGDQIFNQPTVQTVLNETGLMGVHGTPKMPMHIYKSVQDEISAIADTDALVRKLCSQGAGLEYVRDLYGDHTLEAITGSGDAFTFLRNRFNGVPASSSCRTQTIATDLLDLGSLEVLGPTVIEALLAYLQLPVGPIFG